MKKPTVNPNIRHGGPYDRGAADAYYMRAPRPHYFVRDSYNSPKVEQDKMTEDEVNLYHEGFENQTFFKEN